MTCKESYRLIFVSPRADQNPWSPRAAMEVIVKEPGQALSPRELSLLTERKFTVHAKDVD